MYDLCIWCNSINEPWHFEVSEQGITTFKNALDFFLNNMDEDAFIEVAYNEATYYFRYKNITCIRIEAKNEA